jgi:homoaconitate hydratase
VRPEFYDRSQGGANIVVAGYAFGVGSSREQAPKCLIAAGIQVVIARSYAFIYGRNQVNNGLLGIILNDDKFYELAQEDEELTVDVERRAVTCGGHSFKFFLDPIEEQLLSGGGLLSVYEMFGQSLFRRLQSLSMKKSTETGTTHAINSEARADQMEW